MDDMVDYFDRACVAAADIGRQAWRRGAVEKQNCENIYWKRRREKRCNVRNAEAIT